MSTSISVVKFFCKKVIDHDYIKSYILMNRVVSNGIRYQTILTHMLYEKSVN